MIISSCDHVSSYTCGCTFFATPVTLLFPSIAAVVIISSLHLPVYISDHISSLHQWSYLLSTSVILFPVIMSSSLLEKGFDQWAYACMCMSHIQSKSFFKPSEVYRSNLNSLHLLTWHAMNQSYSILLWEFDSTSQPCTQDPPRIFLQGRSLGTRLRASQIGPFSPSPQGVTAPIWDILWLHLLGITKWLISWSPLFLTSPVSLLHVASRNYCHCHVRDTAQHFFKEKLKL